MLVADMLAKYQRLNPYYTGSYSIRKGEHLTFKNMPSLNPYYTGSYSISALW